jgi:hypothetical protein
MKKYKLNFVFDYFFPNFILPNATMPEIGVVNYLASMHTNKAQNATIFEQQIPMPDLFGNKLGGMPNSGTGYFYQAAVYNSLIEFEQKPLYNNNNGHQKFIYPIKPNPVLSDFMGVTQAIGSRMDGEFFWKYISAQATEHILNGDGIIFIDYSMEPFIDKYLHDAFHQSLKNSGIPKENIIICVNSFNARTCYENYYPENERRYSVRNLPFCLDHSSWYYNDETEKNSGVCMTESDFLKTKNTIRKNHFLMKIRNGREHRIAFLYKMASANLLNKGDFSFLAPNGTQYSQDTVEFVIQRYGLKNANLNNIKKLHETAPHILQSEQGITYGQINAWTDSHYQPHINSYFEICFETFVHGDHKSLTEKIFKPIVNFQPFFFVAYPGALQLLKNLGFKTFEGFIDESYDKINNINDRLEAIFLEVNRLCQMSEEEIHNWYWGMEEILIHNHRTLINYHKNRLFAEDLVEEFYNILNGIQTKPINIPIVNIESNSAKKLI